MSLINQINDARRIAGLVPLSEAQVQQLVESMVSLDYFDSDSFGDGDAHITIRGANSAGAAKTALRTQDTTEIQAQLQHYGLYLNDARIVGGKKAADGWTLFLVWDGQ